MENYNLILSVLGKELLSFVINIPFNNHNTEREIPKLSEKQSSAISELAQDIVNLEQSIQEGISREDLFFKLVELKKNNKNLLYYYRERCTKSKDSKWKDDPLLYFISGIIERNYINLFKKFKGEVRFYQFGNIYLNLRDLNEYLEIIKKDPINKLIQEISQNNYSFCFTTMCGLESEQEVLSSLMIIIERSFMNCCNEMSYDYESLLEEVKRNIYSIRGLAQNEDIVWKSYIGIQSIFLSGFDELELKNASLKKLKDNKNPAFLIKTIAKKNYNQIDNYRNITVLKINHETRIKNFNVKTEKEFLKDNILPQYLYQEDKVQTIFNFSLAVIFYNQNIGENNLISGIKESGFPLVSVGSFSSSLNSMYPLTIQKNDIAKIQFWYNILFENYNDLKIPIRRLNNAIFERSRTQDSIIDAIIAWEGLFSGTPETTFKVTTSITKILKIQPNKREKFFDKLNLFYGIRSEIAHGKNLSKKNLKQIEEEGLEKIKQEMIQIGIDCIKILLKNEKLLKLKPSERVKEIVVFQD